MKKFCESLREDAMKVIFYLKDKKYCKVTDHCHDTGEYRGAGRSIYNLKSSVPKKIL